MQSAAADRLIDMAAMYRARIDGLTDENTRLRRQLLHELGSTSRDRLNERRRGVVLPLLERTAEPAMELLEQRGQFDSQGDQSDSQDDQSDNVSADYYCDEGEDISSPTHCHDDGMAPPARVARRAIPLPDAPV